MTGDLERLSSQSAELVDPDVFLSAAAQDRLGRSIPENTRIAYTRQGQAFTSWCAKHHRTPLPATPQTLADYVSHLADLDLAPATIEQAIAAIRTGHRQAGYKGQPDTEGARLILKVHQRDRAAAGKRKKKAPPITLAVLRAMVDVTDPDTLIGLRDRALLILGFSMMARRSELAGLRINELAFTDDGITVLVRISKTDQTAQGAEVHIPPGVHPDTDPVRAVRAWLDALTEQGVTEGPLLRPVNRWGELQSHAMSGAAISERVRTLATRAGVPNADTFTAHGTRSGGATEAAKAGHPVAFIAEHGRWSKTSPQVLEYIRTVDKWRDNPMRGIGL